MRGEGGEYRQLINDAWHLVWCDRNLAKLGVLHNNRTRRLSQLAALQSTDVDTCTETSQDVENSGAAWVQADLLDRHLGPGQGRRSDHPKCRRRHVPGNRQFASVKPLPSLDGKGGACMSHTSSERVQCPLGVIARGQRFGDARRALGMKTGQEHRALHLGTRHLWFEINGSQVSRAFDGQWWPTVGRRDPSAHALQRGDDATHRTSLQGIVTRQRGRKRMRRKNP